jgi:hypothetical protein
MSVALKLEFEQLLTLVRQCDPSEKLELVRALEKETRPVRLPNLLAALKTDELTEQEILREVETVRAGRYAARNA